MNEPPPSANSIASYQPLTVVLAAACGGILLDRYLDASLAFWWLAAAAAWIAWWLAWRSGRTSWAVVPLLLCVAATAACWHHCRWSLFEADHLALVAGEETAPVALVVRAAGGPRRLPAPPPNALSTFAMPERTELDVEVLSIRDGADWHAAAGRTRLRVNGALAEVGAGDRLQVFGQFGRLQGPSNPGEIDFARLARADRRLVWLRAEFPECVTTVQHGWQLDPVSWIDALRTRGETLLWRDLGPRHYGLALAMLLGSRQELDPELRQAFVETGTVHLLVVSGLHVGILAGVLFAVLRVACLPRPMALVLVATLCVLYAVTTDLNPPVVRATVMVLLGCLAVALGRQALGFNVLAAAALIVLALAPAELFVTGTQLSFLSVGVLAVLARSRSEAPPVDPLARLIARTRPWPLRWAWRGWAWIARLALATTAIWLLICPLVMARFHLASPATLLLSPLLAVPMTVAMAAGFGVLLIGWLVPPLGSLLGSICDACLGILQSCVEMAQGWPLGHFWTGGPANWWLAGFYGGLAGWAMLPRWRPARRWQAAIAGGWIALGLLVALAGSQRGDQMMCTFLSVGHGTAVIVELPGGQTLLYDAGRLGSPETAARMVAGYLWSRGIYHLDAVVVSHADADHYNAVPELLEKFSVGAVYVSPVMFEQPSQALEALRRAIEARGVPRREIWGGDHLRGTGEARLQVLHPPRRGVVGSDNANSIVLAIEFRGRRLLLTGDLESPGLEDVLAEEPYDCDVLMAPHHGSASSDPPGFAAWSRPEWTIVSGGDADRQAAVVAAYQALGSRVLHTARSGAVCVRIAGDEISVECWREPVDAEFAGAAF